MAVQKSRKSRSRTGKKRSHMALKLPTLSVDPTTGETHLRHHMTESGHYRGKEIIKPKETQADTEHNEE